MKFDQNCHYTNWKEILIFVVDNTLLCDIISHTRSGKNSVLLWPINSVFLNYYVVKLIDI